MIKLGIIGYPLGHTLSPNMHRAAFESLGVDGTYDAFETKQDELKVRVNFFKENDFRGFNVTIPYKTEIIKYLDEIDDVSKSTGAVNTVLINENKKMIGFNTDVYGFLMAIAEQDRADLKNKNAVVLGAGGAARAILAALNMIGFNKITILARDINKAKDLRDSVVFGNVDCSDFSNKLNLSDVSFVVNTTPLGMQGKFLDETPLSIAELKTLPKNAIVYDIVYKPRETKLLKEAKLLGLKTIEGINMLIFQGAKAFEIWTNQKAPVEIMKEAVVSKL